MDLRQSLADINGNTKSEIDKGAKSKTGKIRHMASSKKETKKIDTDTAPHTNHGDERWSLEDAEALEFLRKLDEEETLARRKEKQDTLLKRLGKVLLAAASLYMVLLIYGTTTTSFQYSIEGSGRVEPVVYTVGDLAKRTNYSTVLDLYLRMRDIYQKALVLDYRVAADQEEKAVIATEYTKLNADEISVLATKISASDVTSDYEQLLGTMYEWTYRTVSDYCKNMAAAITQNDEAYANEALANRTVLEEDFRQITENVIVIGQTIPGMEIDQLKEWSPNSYIETVIEGG